MSQPPTDDEWRGLAFLNNASNNTSSSYAMDYGGPDDLMDSWGYTASAAVLAINGFLGFTLNISVIVLMCKDMQLWNPINIILFNLVCSDFSVSVLGNPLTLTAAIYRGWIFGRTVCICYGFFMAWLGITSIATLTVLSYERLCTVKYPFTTKQLNNRGALVSVALIWSYSLAVTAPPLFGWGAYVTEAANISCSVNWESQSTNTTTYVLYIFFFGLVVPASIITYSYVSIVLVMRSSSMRLGKRSRSERRVTWMVGVMIAAFMVAWTPYSVFSLIKQFGDPATIGPGMAVLPSLFAKTSICYNPIIYVGMNSQFQQAFNRMRGRGDANGNRRCRSDGGSQSQTTTNYTTSMVLVQLVRERPGVSEATSVQSQQSEAADNDGRPAAGLTVGFDLPAEPEPEPEPTATSRKSSTPHAEPMTTKPSPNRADDPKRKPTKQRAVRKLHRLMMRMPTEAAKTAASSGDAAPAIAAIEMRTLVTRLDGDQRATTSLHQESDQMC